MLVFLQSALSKAPLAYTLTRIVPQLRTISKFSNNASSSHEDLSAQFELKNAKIQKMTQILKKAADPQTDFDIKRLVVSIDKLDEIAKTLQTALRTSLNHHLEIGKKVLYERNSFQATLHFEQVIKLGQEFHTEDSSFKLLISEAYYQLAFIKFVYNYEQSIDADLQGIQLVNKALGYNSDRKRYDDFFDEALKYNPSCKTNAVLLKTLRQISPGSSFTKIPIEFSCIMPMTTLE